MRKKILWLLLSFAILAGAGGYWSHVSGKGENEQPWTVRNGHPEEGSRAITGYGCSACHVVRGVNKATGRVGPKLKEIREQIYLGGVLPNTPENMVQWIRNPQKFAPTAMPDLDVSEQDGRNIAAYLYEN